MGAASAVVRFNGGSIFKPVVTLLPGALRQNGIGTELASTSDLKDPLPKEVWGLLERRWADAHCDYVRR